MKIPTQAANGTDATTLGSTDHENSTTALTVSGVRDGSGNQITTVAIAKNATVGGTLDVEGNTGINGDFDISGTRFTVEASSGNTSVGGTLE